VIVVVAVLAIVLVAMIGGFPSYNRLAAPL
jgi:hypothetical protein